ncbi:MAG: MgtC/SapB family protein [Anaerolineae bacterium]|nr:MgtC/SapB family protein [Anaerolineae bacterium]
MLTWGEILLRLVVAALLGGLIGWEREARRKPAGLRTLILVTLSAAMFVVASQQAALQHGESIDAVRAMAGIAQGVGFLGAGAIVQSHGQVRWLTTAAAMWAAAAIGFAAGMGMYGVAIGGGVFVFVTLKWLAIIEDRWFQDEGKKEKKKGQNESAEEDRS